MKKFILSLFVGLFGLVSFSYGQFISTGDGNMCLSYCSIDGFDYIQTSKGVVDLSLDCQYYNDYRFTFNWTRGKITVSDLENRCQSAGYGYVKGFKISSVYNGGATINDVLISYKSSKIPFTVLSPAIDGLVSVTGEFIPYVIYIGIGVLLFSIGFVAIRRLVNWFSSKIKKIFSSKR